MGRKSVSRANVEAREFHEVVTPGVQPQPPRSSGANASSRCAAATPASPTSPPNIPTPGTAEKLAAWARHGATIVYLSSHRHPDGIRADESVIRRYGFPAGPVHGRGQGEDYGPLAEQLGLDVLVEDDCESIGGTAQTCAGQLSPTGRQSIRCIVLPEFSGLAALPDDPAKLLTPGESTTQPSR